MVFQQQQQAQTAGIGQQTADRGALVERQAHGYVLMRMNG
jgi:hypothetical protein